MFAWIMFVSLIMFLFLNSMHFIPQTKKQIWTINIKYRYALQATVLEIKPERRKNVSNDAYFLSFAWNAKLFHTYLWIASEKFETQISNIFDVRRYVSDREQNIKEVLPIILASSSE